MAIILAPTRELCQQLYAEVRKFAKNYAEKLRIGIVFGGGNMYDQARGSQINCTYYRGAKKRGSYELKYRGTKRGTITISL